MNNCCVATCPRVLCAKYYENLVDFVCKNYSKTKKSRVFLKNNNSNNTSTISITEHGLLDAICDLTIPQRSNKASSQSNLAKAASKP